MFEITLDRAKFGLPDWSSPGVTGDLKLHLFADYLPSPMICIGCPESAATVTLPLEEISRAVFIGSLV